MKPMTDTPEPQETRQERKLRLLLENERNLRAMNLESLERVSSRLSEAVAASARAYERVWMYVRGHAPSLPQLEQWLDEQQRDASSSPREPQKDETATPKECKASESGKHEWAPDTKVWCVWCSALKDEPACPICDGPINPNDSKCMTCDIKLEPKEPHAALIAEIELESAELLDEITHCKVCPATPELDSDPPDCDECRNRRERARLFDACADALKGA